MKRAYWTISIIVFSIVSFTTLFYLNTRSHNQKIQKEITEINQTHQDQNNQDQNSQNATTKKTTAKNRETITKTHDHEHDQSIISKTPNTNENPIEEEQDQQIDDEEINQQYQDYIKSWEDDLNQMPKETRELIKSITPTLSKEEFTDKLLYYKSLSQSEKEQDMKDRVNRFIDLNEKMNQLIKEYSE